MVHQLKTWSEWFSKTKKGIKTFELRFNDRDFKEGDILVLQEYDPNAGELTGNELTRKVGHCISDATYIAPGFILMSIYEVDKIEEELQ